MQIYFAKDCRFQIPVSTNNFDFLKEVFPKMILGLKQKFGRWVYLLLCPKNNFQVLFFQLYFNKKYVEVAISDFKMVLIILKWRRKQKFRQKRKTMRQKNRVKEEIVYENVLIYLNTQQIRKMFAFLLDFVTNVLQVNK